VTPLLKWKPKLILHCKTTDGDVEESVKLDADRVDVRR
jgi:hypothetical protein